MPCSAATVLHGEACEGCVSTNKPSSWKPTSQYNMLLYPSSSPPWNTTFRNEEAQVIYKTEFLTRFGTPRQITIKRILPPNSIDLAAGSEDALRDSFSDLAEIHYNFLSGRILYNGIETATNQFFRKSGFLGR